MKINAINNQIFGTKKFRLPVKIVKQNVESARFTDPWVGRDVFVNGNFVREYNNPKAEEFFNKALETDNLEDKIRYLDLMGDYKIINLDLEQKIKNITK